MSGPSTDWLRDGRYGLMVHWLVGVTAPEHGERMLSLNQAVDAFDLETFSRQFAESGADWLIFTLGQNSGYYAGPNSCLDRWAEPGHCSERDLIREVAQRVHALGKRFIAYLPAEVRAQSEAIHSAFAWDAQEGTAQAAFQERYRAFFREYAVRLGLLLDGWWFDGVYDWPAFHNSHYDWPAWFAAARAGNPDALIALNDGSLCIGLTQPVTPLQDFLSGEVEALIEGRIRLGRDESAPLVLPDSRFVPGTECQWHALVPIDCFWCHQDPGPMEPPRYRDEELFPFVRSCHAVGGAVTLNVGISQEGRLGAETLAQLQRLKSSLDECEDG